MSLPKIKNYGEDMKYKHILFDMDGTVLDTLLDLTNAVNYSLRHFSLPERSMEEIRSFLGDGAKQLIDRSVPAGCDKELTGQVLAFYNEWYAAHCLIETAPYPGTIELMEKLRSHGCKLAIVSNKPHDAVVSLAESMFPGLLETAIGEQPGFRRKPEPDLVLHAMETMGAVRDESLYVGDSEPDILTARNVGIDCASVTWGFRSMQQLLDCGAKHIVSNMNELLAMIL